MRKIHAPSILLPLFFLLATTSFQNCDGGFVMRKGELSPLGSLGGGSIPTTVVTSGPYAVTTYGTTGQTIAASAAIETAMDYTLMASGEGVTSAILTWSIPTNMNSASCSLGSTGSNYSKILRCLTAGSVQVKASAIWSDGTMSDAFVSHTIVVGSVNPGSTTNPDVVEFRIRTGTGTGAWNTANTAAVAFVGQTLKIINDDTVNHQLRTNGVPCAQQPAPMATNGFYNCLIGAPHAATAGDLYDLAGGPSATFFLTAIDGAAQYARVVSSNSCVNCHGALASSEHRGASFTSIKAAIMNNRGGMGIYNGVMTDDEIRAIAYKLR